MAQGHDTTGFEEVLQEISESGNPLLTMLRMICQEFMELEVSQKISADRSERTDYIFFYVGKAMATHSSVLAWRIPGIAEPGGLPSMGSHRVRHD